MDYNHFKVGVAGIVFEVTSRYASAFIQCRNYLTNKSAQVMISVTQEDIDFERSQSKESFHTDDFFEAYAVFRKIVEASISYDAILMHGAAISVSNFTCLFTANSGIGKTTHVEKWLDNLPDAIVLNGDKPLIRLFRDDVRIYGTPWCGKEQLGLNTSRSLDSIVIMERAANNKIERISFSEAFPYLLQQSYIPDTKDQIGSVLSILSKMADSVSFYRFQFNNYKEDCFPIAYNTLVRGSQRN